MSPIDWCATIASMIENGETKKKGKIEKPPPYENSLYNLRFFKFYQIATRRQMVIFCISKSRFAIPCQMRAVPGPGLEVLSELQEEGYFGRKSRYTRSVLVEGRGVDRGADDGREIYR